MAKVAGASHRRASEKNMTYCRERVIHSRLNINERFVSRGRIYDNSAGTGERNSIAAAIYRHCPPHVLPAMHRYISYVRRAIAPYPKHKVYRRCT